MGDLGYRVVVSRDIISDDGYVFTVRTSDEGGDCGIDIVYQDNDARNTTRLSVTLECARLLAIALDAVRHELSKGAVK